VSSVLAVDDHSWLQLARCRGEPIDVWFSSDPLAIALAKSICAVCPVKRECLDSVLLVEADADRSCRSGIFAGLSGAERALLARTRASNVEHSLL
jgi:hypothetical protein